MELEEPAELGVELEEPVALGVELEEPVAPELDEPLALCSRWHCSSAAPERPVQSGLEPVAPLEELPLIEGEAELPLLEGEAELPLLEGEALLEELSPLPLLDGVALPDDDPPLDMLPLDVPLALELSVPDDPLGLCAHDAVARPSMAAVIAALSTFNFMAGIPLGLGLPPP